MIYGTCGGDNTGWGYGRMRGTRDWLGGCCHHSAGDEVKHGIHGAAAERADAVFQRRNIGGNCGSLHVGGKGEESSAMPSSDSTRSK